MPSGMSRKDCNTTRVYTIKILIVTIATGKENEGGRELVGNNENKGNNKKDNMNNNIISKIGWNVELLFVPPMIEMERDSATTSSSSSTTSNHPPVTITFISVKRSK